MSGHEHTVNIVLSVLGPLSKLEQKRALDRVVKALGLDTAPPKVIRRSSSPLTVEMSKVNVIHCLRSFGPSSMMGIRRRLGISESRLRVCLRELMADGMVMRRGKNSGSIYHLAGAAQCTLCTKGEDSPFTGTS